MSNTNLNGKNSTTNDNAVALQERAYEVLENSKHATNEAIEKSVEIAKKYPIHSALGAGAVGLVAGVILGKMTK